MTLSRRLGLAFAAVIGVMVLHESEHVVQIWQKDVAGAACPRDCRGWLGFLFDIEWVHFAYNVSIFVALAALWFALRLWRREHRLAHPASWALLTGGVFLVQGYHVLEHWTKLEQWIANGHRSPTPGILGKQLGAPDDLNFSLVELHFGFNTLVFLCVLAAWIGFGFHRVVTRFHVAGVTAVVAAMGIAASIAQPETVRLAAGVHDGTILLDRRQTLEGEAGTIVRGGIRITADGVTVRGLTVRGGEYGIVVDGADQVLIEDVEIEDAELDAINVRRGSVIVRDCRIDARGHPYAQGIDISFGFDLVPSIVDGCSVIGGLEGIVSHFARVHFRDNEVRDTTLRGITVTEMSMGTIEDNMVEDALGVGIFCGDYSRCSIKNNVVRRTRLDPASDDGTRLGFPIQAHFGAVAKIGGNELDRNDGEPSALVDAELRHG